MDKMMRTHQPIESNLVSAYAVYKSSSLEISTLLPKLLKTQDISLG